MLLGGKTGFLFLFFLPECACKQVRRRSVQPTGMCIKRFMYFSKEK